MTSSHACGLVPGRGAARGGYTLAEALIAILLLAVVAHAAWSAAARHTRATLELLRRAEVMDAVRVTGWVLRQELSAGEAGVDWLVADGSVGLRAFRGVGVVCADSAAPGRLVAAFEGVRDIDTAKDSVLLLSPGGDWQAHELAAVRAGPPCRGQPTLSLELGDGNAGGYLVRFFERGSYHLADGAFRYRRGLGGRQPMTARVLGPRSVLRGSNDRAVEATLEGELVDRPPAWTRVLRFPSGRRTW